MQISESETLGPGPESVPSQASPGDSVAHSSSRTIGMGERARSGRGAPTSFLGSMCPQARNVPLGFSFHGYKSGDWPDQGCCPRMVSPPADVANPPWSSPLAGLPANDILGRRAPSGESGPAPSPGATVLCKVPPPTSRTITEQIASQRELLDYGAMIPNGCLSAFCFISLNELLKFK